MNDSKPLADAPREPADATREPADAPGKPADAPGKPADAPRESAWGLLGHLGAALVAIWLMSAYVALPLAWRGYAHEHPAFEDVPNISYDGDDHPGDPVNLALECSAEDLQRAMHAAGWFPADPVTLKSSLEIALATVLRRPYEDAPVSPLYLNGKKQDFSFEQPIGHDPRRRRHVRFWKTEHLDRVGRPAWAGSATLDVRVGLSHTNAQITHHIGPDVDAERDHLIDDLVRAGDVARLQVVPNFHVVREGRNGGGDLWTTDGRLFVAEIRIPTSTATGAGGRPTSAAGTSGAAPSGVGTGSAAANAATAASAAGTGAAVPAGPPATK